MNRRILRLLMLGSVVTAACGTGVQDPAAETPAQIFEKHPVQTSLVASIAPSCTALSIRGTPLIGNVCGGSSSAPNCSPGAVYKCNDKSTSNNCTLAATCASGCLRNGSGNQLNDTCFSGTSPLLLSTASTPGGNNVNATVTLADSHPSGGIVNMRIDRGDLVSARVDCNIPSLPAGVTSATFAMPTAVVPSATDVFLYTDLAYTDSTGVTRELVSHVQTLTLGSGGTAPPPPPLASFTLTPSTIAPGGLSTMNVILQSMAPTAGVPITVTSSNPAIASVIPGGEPLVLGGCTAGGGAQTLQAANQVAQQTTVTVSASSGAAGQAPLTNPLIVTSGCTPLTCVDLPAGTCSGSDGCGGTLSCGCSFGLTCGGGGTPGVCGTSGTLSVSSLGLNPTSVAGGASSTATVLLNAAAPAGGATVTLSSSSTSATVPSSVLVPAGQTTASFTVTTSAVAASTQATISATLGTTQSAILTIAPPSTSTCTPTTCAAQGANCGSIPDGCGGTLQCGTCSGTQTCGGGGAANVCGTAPASDVLTVTATGRTGITVVSNPAGIQVPVGSTGSASFANGTTITLSLTDRTAIWSGACATARDTASCTFTIGGAASVTANVQ